MSRFDRIRSQKIFQEEEEKDRASMRWHDRDPADYSKRAKSSKDPLRKKRRKKK